MRNKESETARIERENSELFQRQERRVVRVNGTDYRYKGNGRFEAVIPSSWIERLSRQKSQ